MENIFGYAKNIDADIETALINKGCKSIHTDKLGMLEFKKMLLGAEHGDIIVINSLHDIANSSADVLDMFEKLFNNGIQLVSLKDSWLNTMDNGQVTSALFLTKILMKLQEFDKECVNKKSAKAMKVQKVNSGKRLKTDCDLELAIELVRDGNLSMTAIAEQCNLSRTTLWKRVKELKEQGLM